MAVLTATNGKYDRTRRGELQRLLGDLGTVLPRIMHGTPEHPAQGWYATLNGDGEVFLGDYTLLAGAKIAELKREHA